MDISSLSGSALTPEVQAQYAVRCIQMARQTDAIVGTLIEDTVEISKEAMDKFVAEIKNK